MVGGQLDSINALVDSQETSDFETNDGVTALIKAAETVRASVLRHLLSGDPSRHKPPSFLLS